MPTSPRVIQDLLSFSGIFILGISVARHQTWTERRTSLHDFPLTTLSTLGLAAVQINVLVNTILATSEGTGAVTFYYD